MERGDSKYRELFKQFVHENEGRKGSSIEEDKVMRIVLG